MKISKKTKSFAIKALLCATVFAVEMLIALIGYDRTASAGFWPQYMRNFVLPTLPFVVLYVLHDILLVPILMNRRNVPLYLSLTFLLVCLFSAYTFHCDDYRPDGKPGMVERKEPRPFGADGAPEDMGRGSQRKDPGVRPRPGEMPGEPFANEEHQSAEREGDFGMSGESDRGIDAERGFEDEGTPKADHGIDVEHGFKSDRDRPMEHGFAPERKPDGIRPVHPAVFKIIMALLLLGVNVGIEYYKRYAAEKRRLQELEKENLKYRLEYLRYQINPHFFMNTLNNIHALVDMSPEKAKESIVELSRLMRHVLYDSNDMTVSLSKEVDFLKHYIYLMRLRYTENVKIEFSTPEEDENAQIPPLLMTTVAENAFKHGISYEKTSFIRLSVKVEDGKIVFKCVNSIVNPQSPEESDGGIGLQNISKRLSLLYGNDFVLHIDSGESQYEVLIVLPVLPREIAQ